ncbi:hypothetical protein C4D60_Mb01t00990 [Musa balbisiana]|uniref:RRM domain-containing protein n=1 Tax=Musa balbisiana TaxID=52838 RepID=A0A4S8JLE3_MUSBA|nr:hypothetical protein C4D60_Mb01t00990 [Musa balbisiana]
MTTVDMVESVNGSVDQSGGSPLPLAPPESNLEIEGEVEAEAEAAPEVESVNDSVDQPGDSPLPLAPPESNLEIEGEVEAEAEAAPELESVNGSVDQPGDSPLPLAPPESNLEIEGEVEAEAEGEAEAEAEAGVEQPREMVFRLNPFAEEFVPASLRNPPFWRVTEELIAGLFSMCGRVIDCRICGDPHSALRFALVEFDNEYGANVALNFDGTILGFHPLAISHSKTAITPVNPSFLPQSAPERARCMRTVYVNNIDSQVTPAEITDLFVTYCGEVSGLTSLVF